LANNEEWEAVGEAYTLRIMCIATIDESDHVIRAIYEPAVVVQETSHPGCRFFSAIEDMTDVVPYSNSPPHSGGTRRRLYYKLRHAWSYYHQLPIFAMSAQECHTGLDTL